MREKVRVWGEIMKNMCVEGNVCVGVGGWLGCCMKVNGNENDMRNGLVCDSKQVVKSVCVYVYVRAVCMPWCV